VPNDGLLESGNVTTGKKDKHQKKQKGDPRILVPCTAAETIVFGDRHDPSKVYGRKKDRAKRGVPNDPEWKSVDMVDDPVGEPHGASAGSASEDGSTDGNGGVYIDGDVLARLSIRSGTRIRPPQNVSEVNGGVGGEKGRAERVEETEDMLEKRREGQQRADEKEMVRCAARRGVAFGFVIKEAQAGEQEVRRKCEAVMLGKVVEPSFAKGDWSIRWREG